MWKDFVKAFGFLLIVLGVIGIIAMTLISSTENGGVPKGHELAAILHVVTSIGQVVTGYILIRLTQK